VSVVVRTGAAALLAWAAVACGVSDPRQAVLEERARWNVTVLSLAQKEDGTVHLSTRVSGPPRARLDRLTVRFQLTDDAGAVLDRVWHTYDLDDVHRGGPADKFVRIERFPHEVAGAGVEPVLQPTEEEARHIPELVAAAGG